MPLQRSLTRSTSATAANCDLKEAAHWHSESESGWHGSLEFEVAPRHSESTTSSTTAGAAVTGTARVAGGNT